METLRDILARQSREMQEEFAAREEWNKPPATVKKNTDLGLAPDTRRNLLMRLAKAVKQPRP